MAGFNQLNKLEFHISTQIPSLRMRIKLKIMIIMEVKQSIKWGANQAFRKEMPQKILDKVNKRSQLNRMIPQSSKKVNIGPRHLQTVPKSLMFRWKGKRLQIKLQGVKALTPSKAMPKLAHKKTCFNSNWKRWDTQRFWRHNLIQYR